MHKNNSFIIASNKNFCKESEFIYLLETEKKWEQSGEPSKSPENQTQPSQVEIDSMDTSLRLASTLSLFDDKNTNTFQVLPWNKKFIERRKNISEPDKIDEFIKNKVTYEIHIDFAWRKYVEINEIWDLEEEDTGILLIRLMRMSKAKYVKLSNSVLHSKNWENLSSSLVENHPLLSILRVKKDDKVTSITFSTLKKVNDEIEPKAWDIIKDIFFEIQNENLLKYFSVEHWWNQKPRLVSRDHKDTARAITQSITEDNILRALFGEIKWKKAIADEIIKRIKTEDLEKIAKLKEWSIEELKNKIREIFNFWINYSTVWKWDSAKLIAHREAVTGAKQWWFESDIVLYNCSPEHTLEQINKHFELENKIIENNRWKKFKLEWVEYNTVIKDRLSGILIQAVRKGKIIESPEWLWEAVSESSNVLNNAIDYIPPFINKDNDIENTNRISKNLDNWIIFADDLEKNYKWYLWKAQYYERIRWSDWLKVSVDIIWMWGDNRNDFRRVARIYKTLMNKYSSTGDIRHKTRANEVLWLAWMTVTKRILSGVAEKLQEKYPKIDIRIWWDEFWFHNPDIKKWDEENTEKFLEDINLLLERYGFKWRTTYSFDKRNPAAIYDKLDNQWKVSKWTELVLEQFLEGTSEKNNEILSGFWITWIDEIKAPNSIVIKVSDEIVKDSRMYWVLLDTKKFSKILKEKNWWEPISSILEVLKWDKEIKKISLTLKWKHANLTIRNKKSWLLLDIS